MLILRQRQRPAEAKSAGEGGYLASASDLMIGLLFVFIILVVVLALEQRKKAEEIEKIKGAADPRASVTEAIGKALQGAGIEVSIDKSSGVISLPSDALFDLGESTLSPPAQETILNARSRLADVLTCYVHSARKVLIDHACTQNSGAHEIDTIFLEGHTDSRPMSRKGMDNVSLSFNRARAIHQLLVDGGSPLQSYRNASNQPLFSYSAYGESRLLPNIAGEDGQNRRVEMRIVLKYQSINETLQNMAKAAKGT